APPRATRFPYTTLFRSVFGERGGTDDAGLDRDDVGAGGGFADKGQLDVAPAGVGAVVGVGIGEVGFPRGVDVLADGEAEVLLGVGVVDTGKGVEKALPPAVPAAVGEVVGEPGEVAAVGVVAVGAAKVVVFDVEGERARLAGAFGGDVGGLRAQQGGERERAEGEKPEAGRGHGIVGLKRCRAGGCGEISPRASSTMRAGRPRGRPSGLW